MPSTRGAITLPPRCTLALGLLLCSVFFFLILVLIEYYCAALDGLELRTQ